MPHSIVQFRSYREVETCQQYRYVIFFLHLIKKHSNSFFPDVAKCGKVTSLLFIAQLYQTVFKPK
jgi:hypothetical protein